MDWRGINTYAYVEGNPVNYIDPTGETTTTIGGYIGGLCGGPVGAAIGAGIGSLIGVGLYYYFTDNCGGGGGSSGGEQQCGGTCASKYGGYISCRRLYDYKYKSLESARSSFGNNVKTHSPRPITSGPCIDTQGAGLHWNVRPSKGSGRLGSISSCTCCEDTVSGPQLKTLYNAIP